MVDMAHIAGLVAGGAHPSPFPHAHVVTSTTQKTLRGPRGGFILAVEELARKIDFAVFPFGQGGPLMHAVAAKAVCFGEAQTPEFSQYAAQIVLNSRAMARTISEAGLRLVSGGTDNHLMLVDLTPMDITGQQAESALEQVGIFANKNAIPFDTKPPRVASGLRLGAGAITSRGFDEAAAERVGRLIVDTLTCMGDEEVQRRVAGEVREMAATFPVPGLDM